MGVEGGLHFAERGVDVLAEEGAIPGGAGQAVAVLATHRAAEFGNQGGDLGGDSAHAVDAQLGLHVEDRANMKAADVGVPVAGGTDAVGGDDLAESVVEGGEFFGGDGGVFDEGDGLVVTDHAHQEGEAGLADLPEVVAGGVGQADADAQDAGATLEALGQVARLLGQGIGIVVVKLRCEDGFRVAGREAETSGQSGGLGGEVEDGAVDHLDGDGAGGDDLVEAIERGGDGGEGEDDEPLMLRGEDDLEKCPGDDGEGSLGADDQPCQVEVKGLVRPAGGADGEAGDEFIEVVAADTPQDARKGGGDGGLVGCDGLMDAGLDA